MTKIRVPLEVGACRVENAKLTLGEIIGRTMADDRISARHGAQLAGVTLDTVRRALVGRSSLDAQLRILAALGVSSELALRAPRKMRAPKESAGE